MTHQLLTGRAFWLRPFRVTNAARSLKKGIVACSLRDLINKVRWRCKVLNCFICFFSFKTVWSTALIHIKSDPPNTLANVRLAQIWVWLRQSECDFSDVLFEPVGLHLTVKWQMCFLRPETRWMYFASVTWSWTKMARGWTRRVFSRHYLKTLFWWSWRKIRNGPLKQ